MDSYKLNPYEFAAGYYVVRDYGLVHAQSVRELRTL